MTSHYIRGPAAGRTQRDHVEQILNVVSGTTPAEADALLALFSTTAGPIHSGALAGEAAAVVAFRAAHRQPAPASRALTPSLARRGRSRTSEVVAAADSDDDYHRSCVDLLTGLRLAERRVEEKFHAPRRSGSSRSRTASNFMAQGHAGAATCGRQRANHSRVDRRLQGRKLSRMTTAGCPWIGCVRRSCAAGGGFEI